MSSARPRPEVWLNCAVSLDGRLAYAGGRRANLSGPGDLARVMRLRAASNAVVVGVGTILADDPRLLVHWERIGGPRGREPTRVVLDSHGRIPPTARVIGPEAPTLVVTNEGCAAPIPAPAEQLRAGSGQVDIPTLLEALAGRGMRQILVEGGGQVLASFLRGGWFDRFTVYTAPVVIGGRSAPPMVGGSDLPSGDAVPVLRHQGTVPLDDGALATYVPAG